MNRTPRTLICAMLNAALLAAPALPAAAQTQRNASPMQQGAGAMMYGSCRVDYLTSSQRSAAAALGALAPAVSRGLVTTSDPTDEITLYCGKDIHDQRCTTKIVAVLGHALTKQNPAGKAKPPSANPGAVVLGTAGAVVGLIVGNRYDHPVIGAATLGWAGAKAGAKWYDGAAAASCERTRIQLDAASAKLGGTLGPVGSLSEQDVLVLIARNLAARRITQAEADALSEEVTRLSGKVEEVLQTMR